MGFILGDVFVRRNMANMVVFFDKIFFSSDVLFCGVFKG